MTVECQTVTVIEKIPVTPPAEESSSSTMLIGGAIALAIAYAALSE